MTGASGQVGGAIAHRLGAAGAEVVGLSRRAASVSAVGEYVEIDIGAPDAAERIKRATAACDAVVHAAATVARVSGPSEHVLTNCLGTEQVVALAEEWPVERFVYVSGVPVIGSPRSLPVTEDHPAAPEGVYLATKLFGEQLVEIARRAGLAAATLRLTSPVGPGTPADRIAGAFAKAALAGEPLRVLGKGTRRQDYVDVRDAAAAVAACLESGATGVFNIARGESISNEELAHLCVRVLESNSSVEVGSGIDPAEGLAWEVSIERARQQLGYEPRHDMADSIRAVADGLGAGAARPARAL